MHLNRFHCKKNKTKQDVPCNLIGFQLCDYNLSNRKLTNNHYTGIQLGLTAI